MSDTVTSEAPPALLTRYATRLKAVPGGIFDLVLVLREDVPVVANAFADQWPGARIHVLGALRDLDGDERAQLRSNVCHTFARSLQQRLDYLKRIERPQVIIEAGNKKRAHKLSCFQQLFYFVAPGGYYVAEELEACRNPRYDSGGVSLVDLLGEVATVTAIPVAADDKVRPLVQELAAAAGEIEFSAHAVLVERAGERLSVKLRDWEADAVLTARYEDGWGTVLSRRPAFRFTSRAEVTSHGEGPVLSGRRTYEVPDRYLRRYHDVVCTARQIVRYGDYLLPDSWRHPHQPNLNNRQLVYCSPYFGRLQDHLTPTTFLRPPGSFYYIDTELPGHFGHVTTDVLSRVWGWRDAVADDPTVRPLLSVNGHGDADP